MKKASALTLITLLITFFTMGFVDLVGIATNYVKQDFALSDTMANLLPTMVFLWFFILSVPTGLLMNKIGRKKTVLLSLIVTLPALLLPIFLYSFESMLVSFTLLGIGNTLMQVSLNPLVASVVSEEKRASTLTFGQFIKAIASFSAPIIAAWGVTQFADWRMAMFPIFSGITALVILLLASIKVEEDNSSVQAGSIGKSLSLLGDGVILILFLGIMAHVGLDVGINTSAPKLLMDRMGLSLADAGYATSFYFIFRTTGCFVGAGLLAKLSGRLIFSISAIMILLGIGALFSTNQTIFYTGIALFGLGNANLFPVIFAQALARKPDMQNEASSLMIMGVCGGAVFPLIMGMASDAMGSQIGSLIVLAICAIYVIVGVIPTIKKA